MAKLNWSKQNKFKHGSSSIADENRTDTISAETKKWLKKHNAKVKKKPKKDWSKIQKILHRKAQFEKRARGDKIDWNRLELYD